MRRKLAEKIKQEFSGFKDVSIRSFFGGFSLNSESTMFGWVDQKNFYLRAHPNYRSLFIDLGMQPLNLVFDGSNKLLDYYKVGDDLLTDRKKLHDIVKIVIEYAKQDQNEYFIWVIWRIIWPTYGIIISRIKKRNKISLSGVFAN